MTTLLRRSLLCSLLLLASAANAQIYKWVDANGQTQYSDAPPNDTKIKAKTVKIQVTSGVVSPNAPESNGKAGKSEGGQAEGGAPKLDPAAVAANCAQARENQRNAGDVIGFLKTDAKGEQRVANQAEESAERDRINKDVEHWCGLAGK